MAGHFKGWHQSTFGILNPVCYVSFVCLLLVCRSFDDRVHKKKRSQSGFLLKSRDQHCRFSLELPVGFASLLSHYMQNWREWICRIESLCQTWWSASKNLSEAPFDFCAPYDLRLPMLYRCWVTVPFKQCSRLVDSTGCGCRGWLSNNHNWWMAVACHDRQLDLASNNTSWISVFRWGTSVKMGICPGHVTMFNSFFESEISMAPILQECHLFSYWCYRDGGIGLWKSL